MGKPCRVTFGEKVFFKPDFVKRFLDTLHLEDDVVANSTYLKSIGYDNAFNEGDPMLIREKKAEAKAEEAKAPNVKEQIESFGVAKEDVDATEGLLSQVFEGLKKAGLTAAKNVGEWVGIGKGKNKPYSLKINGQDVQVKNVSPEVVNGFYSNTENALSQVKQEKMSGNQWLTQLLSRGGNKEEMQVTGLEDYLKGNTAKSVSKADIQQFLKDNRISIVEVVKGAEDKMSKSEARKVFEDKGYDVITDSNGDTYVEKDEELFEYSDMSKSEKDAFDILTKNNVDRVNTANDTKFSQFQLEGDKQNYREILVTLPNKAKWNIQKDEYGIWVAKTKGEKSTIEGETKEDVEKQIKRYEEIMSRRSDGKFQSSHFDEQNILVHLRMNTRTDSDGNKVLFLEEVQSDWGQTGKKEGFSKNIKELPSDYKIKNRRLYNKDNTYSEYYEVIDATGKLIANADTEIEAKDKALRMLNRTGLPTAPFVMDTNAWTKLGLKVALKEAVRQGVDKIAWTTGEQQNDRYDLRKTIKEINHKKNDNGTYRIEIEFKNGGGQNGNIEEKDLEATVGKEIAQKIIETSTNNYNKIDGEGLEVGGKGMKGFYGSPTEGNLGILGNVAKSLFKQTPKTIKIGSNLSADEIYKISKYDTGENPFYITDKNGNEYEEGLYFYTMEDAQSYLNNLKGTIASTQYSIDITPELKASVEGGQPLFKQGESKKEFGGFETRDGKPIGFTYDTDKVARERFDFSKLKKIGSGSDRDVYDLGNGKVLKVAKTARGLTQNIYEGDYYLKDIIPEVFERGLNYVVVDKVEQAIKSTTNIGKLLTIDITNEKANANGIKKLNAMLTELKRFTQKDFDNHKSELQDVLEKYELNDIMSYDVLWGDFTAKRNWGIKDGQPIHLDGGTFGGVKMISSYANKTNLSDPEFKKIYEESKRLKKEFGDTDKATMYKEEGGKVQAQYRIESGKNIIEAIKDFNKSDNKAEAVVALTHEIMHPTVVAIIDGAKDGNEVGAKHTQTIVDEFNKANPKSKITVDELIAANEAFKSGTTSEQYRAVQEFIAESWEKYHTQGAKGFSKAFQDVLGQITKAFQSVYKSIKGKQLTPELTQLFDELLGKQPQAATEANIFDDLDASRVSGAKAKQVASNKAFAEKYGEDAAVAKAISTNFEAIAKELEEKGIFTEINCK